MKKLLLWLVLPIGQLCVASQPKVAPKKSVEKQNEEQASVVPPLRLNQSEGTPASPVWKKATPRSDYADSSFNERSLAVSSTEDAEAKKSPRSARFATFGAKDKMPTLLKGAKDDQGTQSCIELGESQEVEMRKSPRSPRFGFFSLSKATGLRGSNDAQRKVPRLRASDLAVHDSEALEQARKSPKASALLGLFRDPEAEESDSTGKKSPRSQQKKKKKKVSKKQEKAETQFKVTLFSLEQDLLVNSNKMLDMNTLTDLIQTADKLGDELMLSLYKWFKNQVGKGNVTDNRLAPMMDEVLSDKISAEEKKEIDKKIDRDLREKSLGKKTWNSDVKGDAKKLVHEDAKKPIDDSSLDAYLLWEKQYCVEQEEEVNRIMGKATHNAQKEEPKTSRFAGIKTPWSKEPVQGVNYYDFDASSEAAGSRQLNQQKLQEPKDKTYCFICREPLKVKKGGHNFQMCQPDRCRHFVHYDCGIVIELTGGELCRVQNCSKAIIPSTKYKQLRKAYLEKIQKKNVEVIGQEEGVFCDSASEEDWAPRYDTPDDRANSNRISSGEDWAPRYDIPDDRGNSTRMSRDEDGAPEYDTPGAQLEELAAIPDNYTIQESVYEFSSEISEEQPVVEELMVDVYAKKPLPVPPSKKLPSKAVRQKAPAKKAPVAPAKRVLMPPVEDTDDMDTVEFDMGE